MLQETGQEGVIPRGLCLGDRGLAPFWVMRRYCLLVGVWSDRVSCLLPQPLNFFNEEFVIRSNKYCFPA